MGRISNMSMRKGSVALCACLAICGGSLAVAATNAAPADAASVKAYSQSKDSNKFVKSSKAVKSLSAIRIKTKNLSYRVNGKGSFKKSGKVAGKKNKAASSIQIKASGSTAKKYDVYYRTYVKGYGWMGWAKNGAKAGNSAKLAITKYQVKLVSKTAKAPNTDRKAYGNFMTKITGDKKVDAKIIKIGKKAKTIDKAFKWVVSNVNYQATGRADIASTFSASRIKTEAKAAFNKKAGDCYTQSTAVYCLAKYLGYETRPIAGTFTYKAQDKETGDIVDKTAHISWTEVTRDDVKWVYDATNQRNYDKSFELTYKIKFFGPYGETYMGYTPGK